MKDNYLDIDGDNDTASYNDDDDNGDDNGFSEELSEAKMTFNSYVHQVNDIGIQLTDNSQELEVLEVKDTNAKSAEDMQATKVCVQTVL